MPGLGVQRRGLPNIHKNGDVASGGGLGGSRDIVHRITKLLDHLGKDPGNDDALRSRFHAGRTGLLDQRHNGENHNATERVVHGRIAACTSR
jgi:hypothetical protein